VSSPHSTKHAPNPVTCPLHTAPYLRSATDVSDTSVLHLSTLRMRPRDNRSARLVYRDCTSQRAYGVARNLVQSDRKQP